MSNLWILVAVLLCVGLIEVSQAQQSSDEARLLASLMARYKDEYRHTRPVLSHSENVTVGIGLTLIDIQDFNTVTGLGTFYCFDKLTWKDAHLSWEPRTFGGLTSLRMPNEKIWKPDVVLYNSQEMNVDRYESMVLVQHDGSVLYIPRSKYHVRCYITEGDDYQCKLKFGSWVYDGSMLDPTFYHDTNGTEVTEFLANHHWEIVENYAKKTVTYYDCCPEPYPDISFYLKLKYKGPVTSGVRVHSGSALSIMLVMMTALFW